jgi:hypothetical protein
MVVCARPNSEAIWRTDRPRRRKALIAYLSPEVIWRYFICGSPVLGGVEEPEASQIASPT